MICWLNVVFTRSFDSVSVSAMLSEDASPCDSLAVVSILEQSHIIFLTLHSLISAARPASFHARLSISFFVLLCFVLQSSTRKIDLRCQY